MARQAALAAYLTGAEGRQHDILDVGAGTAGTSEYLKRYGTVIAVENNQDALLLASARSVRLTAGDAEALPIHTNSQDILFMLDTLAHKGIRSQERALAEAYRTLRPGGHLLVTVPAFESLWSPYDRAQHFTRRYRRKDIVALLKSQGFHIDRATYLYWLIAPFSFVGRLLEGLLHIDRMELGAFPPWLESLLLKLHLLEARFLGYFELPWGSSIMVRAIKPKQDPAGSHPLRST